MKLSESDKEYLFEIGYTMKDVPQIEQASKKTYFSYKGKRISGSKAIELIGRENFLSSIARSAYHWTAARETSEGNMVLFDSSKYFRE